LAELVNLAFDNSDKQVLLFWSYSGHGHYISDTNNDEKDGRDEVLCPLDFSDNGFITDDHLKKYFIDKLPSNVKLFILIDACHSGTMVDFRYNYLLDEKRYDITQGSKLTDCDIVMISGCKDSQTSADAYLKDESNNQSNDDSNNNLVGGILGNVFDNNLYEYQGAMTAAFLAIFNDSISYYKLIKEMRNWLKEHNFDQVPQLSSGRFISINGNVLLTKYD
jgi:hypothetical protein